MIQQGGVSETMGPLVVQVIGWAEIVLGLVMLFWFYQRWPFILTIVLMIGATAGVVINSPQFLVRAFNPASLNVLMVALAAVGLLACRDLPSARRCLRHGPKAET